MVDEEEGNEEIAAIKMEAKDIEHKVGQCMERSRRHQAERPTNKARRYTNPTPPSTSTTGTCVSAADGMSLSGATSRLV